MKATRVNGKPPKPASRGEIEDAIARAVIGLEKEHTGRGPTETRAMLIDDLIVIRLRGVLTPAEVKLATAETRGEYLVKQSRLELTELKRPRLELMVRDLLGIDVASLHTDLCTRTGERVIVLTLAAHPDLPCV